MKCPKIDLKCYSCYPQDVAKNWPEIEGIIAQIHETLKFRSDVEALDKIRACRQCYSSRIKAYDEQFLASSGIDKNSLYK
jgi:C4-type Zn-finger protein